MEKLKQRSDVVSCFVVSVVRMSVSTTVTAHTDCDWCDSSAEYGHQPLLVASICGRQTPGPTFFHLIFFVFYSLWNQSGKEGKHFVNTEAVNRLHCYVSIRCGQCVRHYRD